MKWKIHSFEYLALQESEEHLRRMFSLIKIPVSIILAPPLYRTLPPSVGPVEIIFSAEVCTIGT